MFEHVCGQKVDISSNCCNLDNSIVCRTMWHDVSFRHTWRLEFVANLKYNFPQSNTLCVWWDILPVYRFCLQFTPLSNGERIFNIGYVWQSYHPLFWDTMHLKYNTSIALAAHDAIQQPFVYQSWLPNVSIIRQHALYIPWAGQFHHVVYLHIFWWDSWRYVIAAQTLHELLNIWGTKY